MELVVVSRISEIAQPGLKGLRYNPATHFMEASPSGKHVGVLMGSCRPEGNTKGIAAWMMRHPSVQWSVADPPVGPVLGHVIPVQVADSNYTTPGVGEWSTYVLSCSAFVVVSPQFNWGYPGELKNALDQLYTEWRGKPVLLITFGGHGGGKCAEQLRQVMGGGLKMHVIEEAVQINLPSEYIRGNARVSSRSDSEFLQTYNQALATGIEKLIKAVE